MCLHKPSFEGGRRGNWGESELVWSNKRFGHPSLIPICPVLQFVGPSMLCNMLGERSSSELVVGDFGRSPPHLFLYLLLFKRKTKLETRGTVPGLNTGESNFCWGKVHGMFKHLSFFLLLFSLYYIFYYGKLCMLGNFAGWRYEWGCTRYVEYLPDGIYQALNKDARVKLYIHKAKPCILFCLAPCVSISFLV